MSANRMCIVVKIVWPYKDSHHNHHHDQTVLNISPLQDTASISLCSWYETIPLIFSLPSFSSPPTVECAAATNKANFWKEKNQYFRTICCKSCTSGEKKQAMAPWFRDFHTAASSPHYQAISVWTGMFSSLSELSYYTFFGAFIVILVIFSAFIIFCSSVCLHFVQIFTCSLKYG